MICFCFSFLGLTFVKVKENGKTDWSACANINLELFENAWKMHNYIDAFNVNTNHWLGQYIYKRLKFLGNRSISHGAALLFLALWHGFHSGYYICFMMEFLVISVEREV